MRSISFITHGVAQMQPRRNQRTDEEGGYSVLLELPSRNLLSLKGLTLLGIHSPIPALFAV